MMLVYHNDHADAEDNDIDDDGTKAYEETEARPSHLQGSQFLVGTAEYATNQFSQQGRGTTDAYEPPSPITAMHDMSTPHQRKPRASLYIMHASDE